SDDVGGGDHTRGTALKGNKDDGLSLIDKLVGCLLERPERDIEALEETRCADQHPTSTDGYADAMARNVLEFLDGCIGRCPAALELVQHGLLQRVAAARFGCSR